MLAYFGHEVNELKAQSRHPRHFFYLDRVHPVQGKVQSQPISMAAATNVPKNWWGVIVFGLNWFMNLIKLNPDRRADPRRLLALSRMSTPPDVMTPRSVSQNFTWSSEEHHAWLMLVYVKIRIEMQRR